MRIGVIYPQIELGGDPRALDAFARAAEALGYDHFAMFDHVAGAVHEGRDPPLWGPYTERDPFHDPLVSFAYLAGITGRIELVTGIMVLPQRQTLLVARQAADVDLFSNGRLRLGVGVGWNHVEFAGLGADFHTRGKRPSEQIGLGGRCWGGRPGFFGGGVPAPAYGRAARRAEGFISGGDLARVTAAWARVRELLAEEGRAVEGFGADYQAPDGTTPQQAAALARRWEDAGGTHFAVRTMKLGYTEAQQHIDHIAEARALIGQAV